MPKPSVGPPSDAEPAIGIGDARYLRLPQLDDLRRRAVAMRCAGASREEVARTLRVRPNTISNWMKRFAHNGLDALKSPKRGRPIAIAPKIAVQVSRILNGPLPSEIAEHHTVWSQRAVIDLLATRYDLVVSKTSVNRLLHSFGIDLQHRNTKLQARRVASVPRPAACSYCAWSRMKLRTSCVGCGCLLEVGRLATTQEQSQATQQQLRGLRGPSQAETRGYLDLVGAIHLLTRFSATNEFSGQDLASRSEGQFNLSSAKHVLNRLADIGVVTKLRSIEKRRNIFEHFYRRNALTAWDSHEVRENYLRCYAYCYRTGIAMPEHQDVERLIGRITEMDKQMAVADFLPFADVLQDQRSSQRTVSEMPLPC